MKLNEIQYILLKAPEEMSRCPFCGGNNLEVGEEMHVWLKDNKESIEVLCGGVLVGCRDCNIYRITHFEEDIDPEAYIDQIDKSITQGVEAWNRRAKDE